MEHGEVTPEFIDSMIAKSVSFHKETVNLASEFYGDQMLRIKMFHKRMCDRYFENQVPMLTNQHNIMGRVMADEYNAWRSTVNLSQEIHCVELEYLRTQCTRPLTAAECPLSKFIAEATQENFAWKFHLDTIQRKILSYHETAAEYRESERLEIQGRLNEHTKQIEEWLKQICENSDDPETVSDAQRALAQREINRYGSKESQFDACIAECETVYLKYLERRSSELINSFDNSVKTCKDCMDDRIACKIIGSSNFVKGMKEKEFAVINNFKGAAHQFLEELSARVQRLHNQMRIVDRLFATTEHFTDEMSDKLDSTVEKTNSLNDYRKEEREKVRELHSLELAEYENLSMHDDTTVEVGKKSPKILNLDLSKFEILKKVGKGAEGSVFLFKLPGALLGVPPEQPVVVAAKKFEALSYLSSNVTKHGKCTGNEEVLTLYKLRHRNICALLGRGMLDGARYLIMEYCPRTLASVIDEGRERNDYICFILLDIWAEPRLADFGLSSKPTSREATVNSNRGTPRYMAPEQHACEHLNLEGLQRCDVWSYGVILWEMMTCRTPFCHIEDHRIPIVLRANDERSRPSLPIECSYESMVNLIKKCWSSKSVYRPSFYHITKDIMPDVVQQFKEEFRTPELWRIECEKWDAAMH